MLSVMQSIIMMRVIMLIVVLLIVVKLSHSACDCHYVIMIVFMIVIMSCCSQYAECRSPECLGAA